MRKGIFISATDTEIGKTVISLGIAFVLKKKGIDVGMMKPVQCAGLDTDIFIKHLSLKDDRRLINPYFVKEPLSPHLAFRRAKKQINIKKIINAFRQLSARHDFLIVEGAGGLLVPIKDDYFMLNLVRDLNLAVVIVARAGLGTINHTLLTVNAAKDFGIEVIGVILNSAKKEKQTTAIKTNPKVLEKLGVPILGRVPFVDGINKNKGLSKLTKLIETTVNISAILNGKKEKVDLLKLDKKFIWHPFTQMKDWLKDEQLVIEEAKGCFLKDTKGNWYLDGVSSLWVNVHGHRKKEIDEAIVRQINRISHATLLGLANKPSIELAERLIEIVPKGLTKVFYSDNGSTAVEAALKMAYQYWQHKDKKEKTNFVHLNYSYHGDTLGVVSVGGIDLFHNIFKPLLFNSYKVDAPYCYHCPKNKVYPQCSLACLEDLENTFKENFHNIAALIIEPIVQAAGGMIVWPEGILSKIKKFCNQYEVLLICDEVATGFGRTGKMFACEHEGVSPDIMCLSKGITGGYLPLAATVTTDEIFNAFLGEYTEQKTFFHGHSFTGNPLSCAAAIANLDIFKKEKIINTLAYKIDFLKKSLERFRQLRYVGDIRQKGFMAGIELVKDKAAKEPFAFEERIGAEVCKKARDYGIILRPLGDVIVLMPPLAVTKNDLNKLLDAAYKAIEKITSNSSHV